MFTILTTDQLVELFRTCLKEGLAAQEDANYKTNDKSFLMIVAPADHCIEVYSYGHRIFKLSYMKDNVRWEEADMGYEGQVSPTVSVYASAIATVYREERERKGLRVIRNDRSKYRI